MFVFVNSTQNAIWSPQCSTNIPKVHRRGLDCCYAYIDDLLIASSSTEEHHCYFRSVLQRLSEYGIILNPAKCVFGVSEPRHSSSWQDRIINFYSSKVRTGAGQLASTNLGSLPSNTIFLGKSNLFPATLRLKLMRFTTSSAFHSSTNCICSDKNYQEDYWT